MFSTEGFETFLNSQKGHGTIPLSYVIRVLDDVNLLEIYETEHEQLTKTVPLYGPDFIIDNGNVYDILKGVILAGPAWPWMQEHNKKRDVCKAWKSLIAHYEGDSVINMNKEAAYASITHSEYLGDRHNFTFETYVTLHQHAHLDLERYGEAIPESKKEETYLQESKIGTSWPPSLHYKSVLYSLMTSLKQPTSLQLPFILAPRDLLGIFHKLEPEK